MNTLYLANHLAIPGTGRRPAGPCRWLRRPRNIAAKRDLLFIVGTLRGQGVPPDAWDDLDRCIERSWKAHRKTRWHERRTA